MIIAIDGPAGSGKSSTARAVARKLGLRHLESGAFYRALTLAALEAGIPVEEWERLGLEDLDALRVSARPADNGFRLFIGDDDVTDLLRSPQVNAHVSHLARVPAVREWLLERLRAAARESDVVSDGRDIGTVVFPNADLKVFLVAAAETRARRRLAEQGIHEPTPKQLAEETARLLERDRIDSERDVAPLTRAPDAVLIDTTDLTFDEQVDRIVELARARWGRSGGSG